MLEIFHQNHSEVGSTCSATRMIKITARSDCAIHCIKGFIHITFFNPENYPMSEQLLLPSFLHMINSEHRGVK